jgi:hypothetical protein
MLMIHQDDIIKRMESQGADTTIIKSQRGSRIGQDNPQQGTYDSQVPPVQQAQQTVHPPQQQQNVAHPPKQQQQVAHPVQEVHPVGQTVIDEFESQQTHHDSGPDANKENMQYMEQAPDDTSQDGISQDGISQDGISQDGISQDNQRQGQQYAEYKDVRQQEKNQGSDLSNNKQEAMMKSFAEDIGKVMGDVIGKIESLNNTVFNLQNELNEVKKRAVEPSNVQHLEQEYMQKPVQIKDFMPDDFDRELEETTKLSQDLPNKDIYNLESSSEKVRNTSIQDFERELDEETKRVTQSIKKDTKQEKTLENISTQYFFPEKVQDIHDFQRELEEETKRASQLIKKENIDTTPDTKTPDTIEEVATIKKPIMSMVNNKKKVIYSLKQKVENAQLKNDDIVNNEDEKNDDIVNNEDEKNDDIVNNEDKKNDDIVNNEDKKNDDIVNNEDKKNDDIVNNEDKKNDDIVNNEDNN